METDTLRAAYPTFPPAAAIAGRSLLPAAGLLPQCSERTGSLTHFGLVESKGMEPEDLAVIGHTGDLLADIYARNLTHIYILPQCSTTAARVLNPAGMDAQFERLRCAISRGILRYR